MIVCAKERHTRTSQLFLDWTIWHAVLVMEWAWSSSRTTSQAQFDGADVKHVHKGSQCSMLALLTASVVGIIKTLLLCTRTVANSVALSA